MRGKTILQLLAGLAVCGALAAAAGAWIFLGRLEPAAPGSRESVAFRVERGQGVRNVANRLEAAGVIQDADAFVLLARVRGADAAVKAGEYEVSPGWSASDVLDHLVAGRVKTYATVLPEGIRATEIADRLAEAGLADRDAFLQVVGDAEFAHSLGIPADSLEGYLYPETYELPKDLSARDLARILVGQFDAAWKQIEPQAQGLALSKHEIVTLASIVEKETAVPSERPLIAAVFLNRLKRGMRLETDPTVIYGIANFDGNLRRRDLRDESNSYNTYQIPGLPPGPIASPGIDALRAVVSPAETEYLYFVSKNDGTHQFSKTYREHVNAVNRYQKKRGSRKP
jgi:UPF0755 protein